MSKPNSPPRSRKSLARFLLASLVVMLVWGLFLPWVAEQHTIEQRLEFLDARGIDPSAMFYTELDAMDKILDELERQSRHSQEITS